FSAEIGPTQPVYGSRLVRISLPGSDMAIGRRCFGCLAQQLRLRPEIDHALRIDLGPRGIVHAPLYVQQRCALLGVEIATPYHCFFRADKSWNDQVSDPL